jgi:serine/threonine-protein kinase
MQLEPGTRLLHYRVLDKIGEGGMGVVWRARDTSLDREVAIKLLPEALAADSERLQRFEREARVLASLNHPHIATIHGYHQTPRDTSTGTSTTSVHFLAMELVEGEDLEQRLQREAIPLERAIEIAGQIVAALETAHAQGVVHRDLKPANVKLTADGDVKLLDFGLAKALTPEAASGSDAPGPTMSPTLTSAGTMAGTILGTAAYMSPEQARGKPVDKRADLWAFGCVLFEMLTRSRCFVGETISDTLASVLKEEPDWSRLPAETPPAIRRLLRRCLAKDRRQRLGDAGAARLELSEALEPVEASDVGGVASTTGPGASGVVSAERGLGAGADSGTARRAGVAGWLPWAIAVVAVVAALATWALGDRSAPPAVTEPIETSIPIPPHIGLNDDQEGLLDLSPDGRYLAFIGRDDAALTALYLRRLSDATIVKVPDSAGAMNPVFSPDSRWIAFFAEGMLRKIQVDGTAAITICAAQSSPRGATWSDDDRIIFPQRFVAGLSQVDVQGGEPAPLTELDAERRERTHRWPYAVPGHDVVLYTVATTDSPEFYDDARIDALRLSTGEVTTVLEGASLARYVPTGHLVFGRGGFLYGVPFDIDALQVRGKPAPVVEGVTGAVNSGQVYAAISQSGLLAYVPGKPESPRKSLTWLYADGRDELLPGMEPGAYIDPAISPDGKRVAVARAEERSRDIWVYDLERGSRVRLTFGGENTNPTWTPDGRSIVYASILGGHGNAFITAADGTGEPRPLHAGETESLAPFDVSRDGRLVALELANIDIYTMPLGDPDAELTPFLTSPADELMPHFSPDARWIAYASNENGGYQVFVRPFPGPGGRWQISASEGVDPRWSPDGRQIHYRTGREWWTVDVEPGDGEGTFRVGVPRLVRSDLPRASLLHTYGMSVKGDAVLLPVAEGGGGVSEEIRIVVGWGDELIRAAGTGS